MHNQSEKAGLAQVWDNIMFIQSTRYVLANEKPIFEARFDACADTLQSNASPPRAARLAAVTDP